MTIATEARKYGEAVLDEARKPLLAAVGATDLAYDQLRGQLKELPAETQAQLRRLQQDVRIQFGKLQDRAQANGSAVRPGTVRQAVESVGTQAREAAQSYAAQVRATYDELARRGSRVVRTLRRRPEIREAFDEAEEQLEHAEEFVTGRPARKAPARKAPARRAPAHS